MSALRNDMEKQGEQLKELKKLKKLYNDHDTDLKRQSEVLDNAIALAERAQETAVEAADTAKMLDDVYQDVLERLVSLEERCSTLEDGNDGDDEADGHQTANQRNNALAVSPESRHRMDRMILTCI